MKSYAPLEILTAAGLVICLLGFSGCTTVSGTVRSAEMPAPTGCFRAGAAQTDITPPPGMPMGGHSVAGQIGRGYWTRLSARAIYFEDQEGQGVALVSCDLWSISAGLSDRVAELVRNSMEGRHLGRHQILIAATHTHQSPGNFSSTPFYNGFASPKPGFDHRLFDFLAVRIKEAIVQAIHQAEPARVSLGVIRLSSVARNRSYPGFKCNPEAEALVRNNRDLPVGPVSELYPDPDCYRALDPDLRVLRVESADKAGRVIALVGFFGVHPTAMSHETCVYNGDIFGVAVRDAERRLQAAPENVGSAHQPIAILFNGAEGDVSPIWDKQNRVEALQVGTRIANGLLASPATTPVEGEINAHWEKMRLAGASLPNGENNYWVTDEQALPGAGMLGGAEDGRTSFYCLGWEEGVKATIRSQTQGNKLGAFDWDSFPFRAPLTRVASLLTPAPREVPVTLFRVGSVLLAGIPVEPTTVTGLRLRRTLLQAPGRQAADALIIGLANEYISYLATPDEYESQQYEGASTLYGPASEPLFNDCLARLATTLNSPAPHTNYTYKYRPGPKGTFDLPGYVREPTKGLENLLTDINTSQPLPTVLLDAGDDARILEEGKLPSFEWDDILPDLRGAVLENGKRLTPAVSVEFRESERSSWLPFMRDGWREDDTGLNFVTVGGKSSHPAQSHWCAVWLLPPAPATGWFRLRVQGLAGGEFISCPFRIQTNPKESP